MPLTFVLDSSQNVVRLYEEERPLQLCCLFRPSLVSMLSSTVACLDLGDILLFCVMRILSLP